MADCLKPVKACVDVGQHDPPCTCRRDKNHDGPCASKDTIRVHPRLLGKKKPVDRQDLADVIMAKTVWQSREGTKVTAEDRDDFEYSFCLDAADAILALMKER